MQDLLYMWVNDWDTLGSTRQAFFLLALVSTLLLLVYVFFLLFPISEQAEEESPDRNTLRVFASLALGSWVCFVLDVLEFTLGWSLGIGLVIVLSLFLPTGIRRRKKTLAASEDEEEKKA